MTTNEAADQLGVSRSLINKWCLKNGIERKLGKQGVMEYQISDEDIKKFQNREKKPVGRPNIENPVRPRKSTRK